MITISKEKILTVIRKENILTALLIAASAVALYYSIAMIAQFPKWLVDDAFIIFRYAENLAVKGELTWNPGENPAEGYTGVTLVWLIALAMKLGISPITATHVIGVFSYFCGAVLIVLILRGFNMGSVIALILYLTAPFFFTHAWSGLETTMFTTAILFAIYTFTIRHEKLFVVSLLLLSFTRPEGILLSVILLISFRPFSRRTILLYLIPLAIYFVWRWAYYGQLLPNTFYAKSAGEAGEDNFKSLRLFFNKYLQLPVLLTLIFVTWDSIKKHKFLIVGILVFSAITLYTYISSNLIMNYAYRFFVPFYPLVLLALGGVLLRTRVEVKMIVLILVLMVPQTRKNIAKDVIRVAKDYASTHHQMLEDEHIALGKFLKDHLPPQEWLVVHADAGAIPYYSKLKTVDFGRLNDEFLAGGNPSSEEAIDYLYSFDPGAIVFTSRSGAKVKHGDEADSIIRDSRFENYNLVKKYSSKARRTYFEFLYVRKDLAESIEIGTEVARGGLSKEKKRTVSIMPDLGKIRTKSGSYNSAHDRLTEAMDSPEKLWIMGKNEESMLIKKRCYRKLVDLYPSNKHAPEALWELSVVNESPASKIRNLRELLDLYPEHEFAPKALFMIGFIFNEDLNNKEMARNAFNELIEKYPNANVKESALWMLENLNVTSPKLDSTAAPPN